MIAQLTGRIVSTQGTDVVLDVHGVGYLVSAPLSTVDIVAKSVDSVTLLTVMHVREDAMQLFGFASEPEREAFRLLTSIQGIGGRTALGILSAGSLADLRLALVKGNLSALQRLPGVGKKTAERMVVELRDKIIRVVPDTVTLGSDSIPVTQNSEDAISALQALGYNRAAAEKAVRAAIAENADLISSTDALIRMALRYANQ